MDLSKCCEYMIDLFDTDHKDGKRFYTICNKTNTVLLQSDVTYIDYSCFWYLEVCSSLTGNIRNDQIAYLFESYSPLLNR